MKISVVYVKKFFPSLFLSKKHKQTQKFRESITIITKFSPSNLSLYKLALQHSSIKNNQESNERLEFLGDAVLSMVTGEYLFKKYPYRNEGFLTEARSKIVNRETLNDLARKIGMDKLVNYDTRAVHGKLRFIYGNALEAFTGAVYLDQGYKTSQQFIIDEMLTIHIDLETFIETTTNYKSKIVEWAHQNGKELKFALINKASHKSFRTFTAQVIINEKVMGEGNGETKKKAEQTASEQACRCFNVH